VRTLLYIGHNPAAAELVALLTGTEAALPTAGIAVLRLPGPWAGLAAGQGELTARWQPPDES
jgi:phosphohistidine phosphatase SixA